jgi:hypothetical protein
MGVKTMNLPTAPPKATDRRQFKTSFTVQAEAIPPDVRTDILKRAIEERQCPNTLANVLAAEQQGGKVLNKWARQ